MEEEEVLELLVGEGEAEMLILARLEVLDIVWEVEEVVGELVESLREGGK